MFDCKKIQSACASGAWQSFVEQAPALPTIKEFLLRDLSESFEAVFVGIDPQDLRKKQSFPIWALTDKLEAKAAATLEPLERLQTWPVYDALQTSWHLTLHWESSVRWKKRWLELSGGLYWHVWFLFIHICLTGGILTCFGMFGVRECF